MKKIILLFFILIVGCNTTYKENNITILVPYGVPLIALGGIMDLDNVTIDVVSGPDLLISAMTSKSHDIIISPLNIGAKLYMAEASVYKLDSILTLNNNFIISRKSLGFDNLSDLNDRDIMGYGQNSTPDIILKHVIEKNDLKTNITYQPSLDLLVSYFVCNPNNPNDLNCGAPTFILTTEPVLTKIEVIYKIDLNIIDLQEILKEEINFIPQATIFVNPLSPRINEINQIIELIRINIDELNNDPNQYAKKIVSKHAYFTNLTEEVIAISIPRSNIVFIKAKGNVTIINQYYQLLNAYNSNLLGGQIPNQGFYN